MWKTNCTHYYTSPLNGPNMHPINGRAQIMVLQTNWKLYWKLHQKSQKNTSARLKKEWSLYYNMPMLWTALFCQPSTQQLRNRRIQLKALKLWSHISLTMQPLILTQYSNLELSIWYYTLIVMHHTYQNHGHTSVLEGTTELALIHTTIQNLHTYHTKKYTNPHII